LFWGIYLIIQISLWIGLGIFLKRVYLLIYKDGLTKLWNRRYLYVRLGDEIKKLKKKGGLSLAIVDIDNFKSINDAHGHLFGDKVLTKIANTLQGHLRKNDIIARWGGEEFIIVLPETDAKGTKAVLERTRKVVEENDFGCRITISGGIAFTKAYMETNNLIEMADKALYKAKRTKNLIAVYKE
jgi:diguanylate cyclase